MLRWMVHLVTSLGPWGVGLLMAIENVVLPLPSELIMPLGGFVAARGRTSLWWVIVAGTVGSVVGALPVYAAARWVGERKVRAWLERHGRWLLLRRRDLDRTKRWFDRHGSIAVAVGQLVPGVRGLISLPGGFAGMGVVPFMIYNALGTFVWCAVLATAGYQLGAHFEAVHRLLGPISWGVLGALLVIGVVWLWRRRVRAG